jgi:signal transduction histidine kinase
MMGHDVASEISTRVVSVFFLYFEHTFGRERLLEAFAAVGGTPTLAFVLDPENFVSLEYCERVARVLTESSGNPHFLREAGQFQLQNPRMLGFAFYLMRSLGSPRLYYRMAVRMAPAYNRVCEMHIEELTDRKLRLRYRSTRPEGTRLMCEGRLGQLAAAPTLWGLPPAEARELECQTLGAPACRYEFRWVPRARPALGGLAGATLGAAVGALWPGARGAGGIVVGAAVGAFALLAHAYRGASHATAQQLFDAAEGTAASMNELRRRFEEVQRLHVETEASHHKLREEMRRRQGAEAALIEAQKLEAVGRLSGGIAHDFNNVLAVVLAATAAAKAAADSPTELAACLDAIEAAARSASELTKRLLAFARRQVVAPRVVDVEEHLRQLDQMVRALVGKDVALEYQLGAERACVLIDPTQLEQVLMNLTVNARDAMPGGGTLSFETARATLADGDPTLAVGLEPGVYVRIDVTDSGHGMDEATRERAFEPFFTTKEKGRGTGFGLATCHGIISQAKGAIAVRSVPGAGTTFTVHLPRVEAGG